MEAMAYCVVPQRNFVAKLQMKGQTHGFSLKNIMFDFHKHYEKKRCFATSLATQFLNCIGHLQLTIFICYDCYQTSYKSCKSCNSPYIWCNSLQFNYNFVATIPFQLLCNSPMTIILMSCWSHFSSIHQNLTCGIMRIFCDFFEILISIVHYDYLF
jgi:hypothetical protein